MEIIIVSCARKNTEFDEFDITDTKNIIIRYDYNWIKLIKLIGENKSTAREKQESR